MDKTACDPFCHGTAEQVMATTTFYIGDWLIEPGNNQIRRDERTVKLEPRAMEVLLCLSQNPGQVVSREHLEETVWTDRIVTQDSISTAVNKLRKAFEDSSREPQYIETVAKRGYRLIAPITPTEPSIASQQQGATPYPAKQNVTNKNKYIVIGLLLLAVFSLGLVWLTNPDS